MVENRTGVLASAQVEGVALVAQPGGRFELARVVAGAVGPHDIAIATAFSGVGIGTELAALSGRLDWGPFPMVTGRAATGYVSMVGAEVADYAVGDAVYYSGNRSLRDAEAAAPFNCRQGAHASVAVVDTRGESGLVPLTPGLPMDAASLTTVQAAGLHSVDVAGVRIGDIVVVIGADLVGLGVIAAASSCGAHVIASDPRPVALQRAGRFGAQTLVDPSVLASTVADLTRSRGADIVFETTGTAAAFEKLTRVTRKLGKVVFQGPCRDDPLPFTFAEAHAREITMIFPRVDGQRHTRAVARHGQHSGRPPSPPVLTDLVEAASAVSFFRDIYDHGPGDIAGAVIDWREVGRST